MHASDKQKIRGCFNIIKSILPFAFTANFISEIMRGALNPYSRVIHDLEIKDLAAF